uniref:Centromere protein C n=1 Tax=Kalanchoe fedtschenkoi TaxID=63787 RepID=A0A7N0RDT3_KALFE
MSAVQEDFENDGESNEENVRKRRPGLGRKQAKFNFNRKISQPAVIKQPTLDIAKLEDPVELFLAHQRLENAEKEIRKLTGNLTDIEVNINDLSLTPPLPRRPRIPGFRRSKATYKHHCYSLYLNDDGLKVSSTENLEKDLTSPSLSLAKDVNFLQEASKQNQQSPFNIKMHLEAVDPVEVGVLGDSISEENRFLDEILFEVYDHLNSDRQFRFLEEQSQIRPMDIDKAAFFGMSTTTSVRAMHTPSSIHFSASPTPPKSPFANLSSLRKHIMLSNGSLDSFSIFDFDPNPIEVSNSSSHCEELQDSRDFAAFVDDSATAVPNQSGSALLDKNRILVEAESRPESYKVSPVNELTDTQVQTEHASDEIHPHKKQKRKDLSITKSIAAAGTSLQSGVRRSTRLKTRPLEFWRGERFLYGRLEPDSTSPTLIGVKMYATPARQDSEAALQVVPCVDGERYRELIDLAALH